MYVLCDLPDLKGNSSIVIKGEITVKSEGEVKKAGPQELNTEEGGSFESDDTLFQYKILPRQAKSPWCYLTVSSESNPEALKNKGFAPVFLDADGKKLAASPQRIKPQQRKELGIDADTPVKLYRFRNNLPSAVQTTSKGTSKGAGEGALPVALKLQLGASPNAPKIK